MNQFAARRRDGLGQIVLLAQNDIVTAPRGITRDTGAIYATADDQNVEICHAEKLSRIVRRSILRLLAKVQCGRDDGAQPAVLIDDPIETNSIRNSFQPACFRHSNYGD